MPAPSTFLPPRSTHKVPEIVGLRLITPREAALEGRIAAIEKRLHRQDSERASWERLKMLGLILAA